MISKIATRLTEQNHLLTPLVIEEAKEIYDSVVASFREKSIDIPRMILVEGSVKAWFDDFELDTSRGLT